WLMASILAPLCFLAFDPVIWSHPRYTLVRSVLYEWYHSVGGHLTFLAGSYDLHVPHWTVFYIVINKISAFVTVPAAIFCIIALMQLIRFHLPTRREHHKEAYDAADRKGQYRSNNELAPEEKPSPQDRRKAPHQWRCRWCPHPPLPRSLR